MDNNMFTPGFLVKEKNYVTSDMHSLIGVEDHPGHFSLDNIGKNGENLTIAVLSMNRSALTIRLLKSVRRCLPDFAGKFLIGDNGSTEAELNELRAILPKMPFDCRIIEFGQNYGVAGGRNRLFAAVETDWLLSLDNDLHFTSNPLPQAQKDINAMGVQFLAMPLVDTKGQSTACTSLHLHMYSSNGVPVIALHEMVIDDAAREKETLCTGILGGTAIMNKYTFLQSGGYDEDIKRVGFDEVFSMKLFQKGYKVGKCGKVCLERDHIENHVVSDEDVDIDHIYKTYGTLVYSQNAKKLRRNTGKARIALVPDRPGWAFDNITNELVKNLSDEFDFDVIYAGDVDNVVNAMILAKDCQMIHIFWRGFLAVYADAYVQSKIEALGLKRKEFEKMYVQGKVLSTEVYDHLLLEGDNCEMTENLLAKTDSILTSYAVSSWKLKKIYDELPGLRLRPNAVLPDGVDLSLFHPSELDRLDGERIRRKVIRFGWVGNSKWVVGDLKGINTIIRPAIQELQAEGFAVELYTSDRQDKLIPHEDMPQFYKEIDCYICASICEGTPNPVLEAMACGIPVITTDVGLVPELFGPLQKEFVLEERTVPCLKEKIKKLLAQPEQFAVLSAENLEQIQKWDWKIMAENFRKYFRECLKKQNMNGEKCNG